jgi:hypothetical protein
VRALSTLLSACPEIAPIDSIEEWWERHRVVTAEASLPIEEAMLGGFAADRLGYAFVSGYEAALHALVPDLPRGQVASFCITERAGAHPAMIEAQLSPPRGSKRRLHGHKRWATLPGGSGMLLVAASEGKDEQGQNKIRIVRVASTAPGVVVEQMSEVPFVPEITRAEVLFEDVVVTEEALLPGDGYTRYIKPFRTIEDIHVHAAILAYLVRETRVIGFTRSLEERLSATLTAHYALASCDPSAPETHIALAGVLQVGAALMSEIEPAWARSESPAHARWERDRILFDVAQSARAKRRDKAWRHFELLASGVPPKQGDGFS